MADRNNPTDRRDRVERSTPRVLRAEDLRRIRGGVTDVGDRFLLTQKKAAKKAAK